jgi:hypothetical protein
MIYPQGSRFEPGVPMGVGPRLCWKWTSEKDD